MNYRELLDDLWIKHDADLYAMIDMYEWLQARGKEQKEILHLIDIAGGLGLMKRRGFLTVTYEDKFDFQYWLDTLECLGYDKVYKNRGTAKVRMAGQEIEVMKKC